MLGSRYKSVNFGPASDCSHPQVTRTAFYQASRFLDRSNLEVWTDAQARSKLMHKTPARFLGLIGPRPDERTLPLTERLENYRDAEASAMALATSGNGMELLHSKAVPRWCWVAFWTAASVAFFFIPALPGLEAWFDLEYSRLTYAIAYGVAALLPLISRSGRVFVHGFQWGGPFYLFQMWVGFAFDGVTSGHWAVAGFWGPLLFFEAFHLLFRKRLFLSVFFVCGILGLMLHPAVACFHYGSIRASHFATYAECGVTSYTALAPIYGLFCVFLLFLIGNKCANNMLTWRLARTSRERHRLRTLKPEL